MPSNEPAPEAWQRPATGELDPQDGGLRDVTRVLCIAEDVDRARREVLPVLSKAGLEIDLMPANTTAVASQLNESYQLVLLDIGSRNGNGFVICTRIRRLSPLPVMLVLRGAAREQILRGFQCGADAYVVAPFDRREFLARLNGLLRR